MIDKTVADPDEAVSCITDGSTVMVGGFGGAGAPEALIEALRRRRLTGLTVIANNAGSGEAGLAGLLADGSVSKIVCSYPRMVGADAFRKLYEASKIELELCPQGTLIERIRAAAAGLGGFYTRTAVGTDLADGKDLRYFDGQPFLLERPLHADFALVRAARCDRWGNLVYSKAARNFGPAMAMAASVAIVEVQEIVPLGDLDPESVVTAGVFVDRLVVVATGKEQG